MSDDMMSDMGGMQVQERREEERWSSDEKGCERMGRRTGSGSDVGLSE